MSSRPTVVLRLVLLLVLAAPALQACGTESSGVDRNRYQSVYEAAMLAVHERDLKALWPLLTERSRDRVEANLREWQSWLRDEAKSERILALAREELGTIDSLELERARKGTLEDAWLFFLKADPRPAKPSTRKLQAAPDGRSVDIEYQDPRGALRKVRLVQLGEGWYIDELEL